MLFGDYRFRCRFESDAQLPAYKGSTLRGVLGRALKQVVCALKRQECPTCLLKQECLFPLIFEPRLIDGEHREEPLPHPFVLHPPITTQTHYSKGDPFNFDLLLFGPANQRLAYIIYACDRMGRIGIGKKINGSRAEFHLETVLCAGQAIYQAKDQRLINLLPAENLEMKFGGSGANCGTITFHFETPVRIKHQNHLSGGMPFHVLVRAMLRRVSALLTAYDKGEPDLDYAGLVQRAQAVQTEASTLVWEDLRRYSHRQDTAMLMGGLKGTITYTGNLAEYLPLIEFCARVNVGKQTTFGLGRFTVECAR
jgi:hypothetical protein